LRQLDGGLSMRIAALRDRILELEALLAYDIDFPEEDDGPVPRQRIADVTATLRRALDGLLATATQGRLIHEGALVVLAGAPNVGKSSLFNALLGEARAIVTAVPGTTRDAIEAVLDLPAYPARLVDTAGLRETSDEVERLGIAASARYLAEADVVLVCGDDATTLASGIAAVRGHGAGTLLRVATKCDLVSQEQLFAADVRVSAMSGEGLGALLAAVESRLAERHGMPQAEVPVLTSARQRAAVAAASAELTAFEGAWSAGSPPASIAAIHVHAAGEALAELIGTVHVDDVLSLLFASFCVGK
jgi:tRNA modification GTPase